MKRQFFVSARLTRFSSGGLKNVLEASILQGNGETAIAISPNIAGQGLTFGVSIPAPHGEEAR
ncbi:hypothetical protein GWE18_20080 [Bradyrhizobium sp. CSA112]|uniref:hypothetical protein n=1 Tax=Bradyrhizobium sp. CSA112 TaxID=2699170 RepID=UPI0023AF5EF0|nr:hypothetical protein [Bradyrhizobium sp. CSA112]MDE5455100.1 hypothetical protein [Bradyrhizobium sp. CSA112]